MILDLILILIILLFSFLAAKRGFVGSVLSFLNKIIALIVALAFAKPLSTLLLETPIASLVEKISIPTTASILTSINAEISSKIQSWVLIVISFVILFIVSYILFKLIRVCASAITNLPVLKQFDSLFGFMLGFASCVLAIYVLLGILSIFQDTSMFSSLFERIDNSYITKFLYNNNIIVNILFSPEVETVVEDVVTQI